MDIVLNEFDPRRRFLIASVPPSAPAGWSMSGETRDWTGERGWEGEDHPRDAASIMARRERRGEEGEKEKDSMGESVGERVEAVAIKAGIVVSVCCND